MRLGEIIEHVDKVLPNAFSNEEKVVWLNEAESEIQRDVLLWREIREHVWNREWSGTASAPEGALLELEGHLQAWPGGRITVSDGEDVAAEADILRVEHPEGRTVLRLKESIFEDVWSGTVNVTYNGRGDEMAAPPFFAKIYYSYLEARIHGALREWEDYANIIQLYNKFLNELNVWFAREYIDGRRRG